MWEFKQFTSRLPERACNGGNPSHHLIVNLMNASFNVTVMYNTALIAHGRGGEGAQRVGMEGIIKGVGSKTEKQERKVGRRDAKRAPRLCQSQIGVLSSRW